MVTIRISDDVHRQLQEMRREGEGCSEVIERVLEDSLELNKKTKQEIAQARKRVNAGRFLTQAEAEKRLGI